MTNKKCNPTAENIKAPSLWELFWVFAKIGAFTFGGGYAMIALIEREIVAKRKWMDQEEFTDSLTIAQSAPGLLAVNISIFVGYKLFKNKGSVVATVGSCLPSFLMILAIALFFASFRENLYVEKFFKGLRPAVVALIAVPVFTMVRRFKLSVWRLGLAALTALLIIFLKVSPVYILLVAIICFVAFNYYREKKV